MSADVSKPSTAGCTHRGSMLQFGGGSRQDCLSLGAVECGACVLVAVEVRIPSVKRGANEIAHLAVA